MILNRIYLPASFVAFLISFCTVAVADDDAAIAKSKSLQDTVDAWSKAIEEKDRTSMSSILADDFLNVDVDGKVRGKQETIKFLAAENLTLRVVKRDNDETRMYADTAVMTARVVFAVAIDGNQGMIEVRDIHCWKFHDNRWQLTVYQSTQVE